jgi:class 3 adenylate cyclase
LADRLVPDSRDTKEGPIVLADISGYTSWVAATELEHSRRALALLLEAMIEALRGRLEAGQVAGDAVLFVGEGLDPSFVSWLDDAYREFQRTVSELGANNTCGCRACDLVPTLTMKALAHYGRYNVLRVGPSQQLHGADVIVPHRLAKNSVPSREYVLATPALAERLSEKDRARFTWRDEDAGEFGKLRVGYYDLKERTSRDSPGR